MEVQQPIVEQKPVEKPVEQKPVEKQDLVARVAQFKKEEKPTPTQAPDISLEGEPKFDFKQLEAVKTPEEAKRWAEDAYKSLQRGYNQKYETVAEMRKELEKKMSEQTSWTPQRIQALLQDPNFVQAAQTVMQTQAPKDSGMTDEEWSALSEGEKAKLQSMEKEIINLRQQNQRAVLEQQDKELMGKYANYQPQAVESLIADLSTNRVVATREHLWKVIDYEAAVQRAYELGRQDARSVNQDKFNASNMVGNGVNTQPPAPLEPKNGKIGADFFMDLYRHNETRLKEAQMQK